MSEEHKNFLKDSGIIAFDTEHRKRISFNMSKYDAAVQKGLGLYMDMEAARKKAAEIKLKVIRNLDKHIIDFTEKFESRGGKVLFAEKAEDASKYVLDIALRKNARKIVKSKSMITEEIELNDILAKNNIESLETDLGEYIVQLAGEKPYHIVTPAMHKSKEDIARLFHEKFNIPEDSSPEEITAFVRGLLRDKFLEADIGITGANFVIANQGAIALTENEGNGFMSFSFPKTHIVICGIEKFIPDIQDLDLFWPLLATHGTGQHLTVYNSVISGPRQQDEPDGPEEMYVIFLDNGRTKLLSTERQWVALTCIRCGACLNACPVYRNIGGYTYGTTYSGPIGSVISPYLINMERYKHLSFASSLCGKCTEVCPVNIPLHELLLVNRNDSVKKGHTNFMEKATMWGWKKVMLNPGYMDLFGGKMKNWFLSKFFRKTWGNHRELPLISKRSFRKLYQDKNDNAR